MVHCSKYALLSLLEKWPLSLIQNFKTCDLTNQFISQYNSFRCYRLFSAQILLSVYSFVPLEGVNTVIQRLNKYNIVSVLIARECSFLDIKYMIFTESGNPVCICHVVVFSVLAQTLLVGFFFNLSPVYR